MSKSPVQIIRNGIAPVGGGNDKDFRPTANPVPKPPDELAQEDVSPAESIPSFDLTPSPDLSDSSPDPHPSQQTPDLEPELETSALVDGAKESLSPSSVEPPSQDS